MTTEEIIEQLKALADEEIVKDKKHFGVDVEGILGIRKSDLRPLARRIGTDQQTALELWSTGIHEARTIAVLIADARVFSEELAEQWILDVHSWDMCDQFCSDLLRKTPYAHRKAVEWSTRPEEYVRRAAFVLMAVLAVHDKKADDEVFQKYLRIIREEASDERNFVKKAVNWALRQIGKRDLNMNRLAVACAEALGKSDSSAARWVAADALRELKDEKTLALTERRGQKLKSS